jgi:hypothetical protein
MRTKETSNLYLCRTCSGNTVNITGTLLNGASLSIFYQLYENASTFNYAGQNHSVNPETLKVREILSAISPLRQLALIFNADVSLSPELAFY